MTSQHADSESGTPQFGRRIDPEEFRIVADDPELPPTLSAETVAKKRKWARVGIIATALYGAYGALLLLVIEPISASGRSLSEAYALADSGDNHIGVFESIMFALVGIGLAIGLRTLVLDRDKILPGHVQILYLVLIVFGGPALILSSLGTTVALAQAFGRFGPTSGFWYILPFAVSTAAAFTALIAFLFMQANRLRED